MARSVVSCNDGFLFGALAYSIFVLVTKWESYSDCRHPLHVFLLVDYCTIMVFRLVHFLAQCSQNQSLLVKKTIFIFKSIVLYTFFVSWTVLGTVWFSQEGSCLPETNQYWTFIVWLILCYVWIALYACLLVLQATFRPDQDLWDPNTAFPMDLMRIVEQRGLTDRQIQSLQTIRCDGLTDDKCAICIEPLEKGQECKRLPTCRHSFHSGCINSWLTRKSDCPVCRSQVEIIMDEI